MESRRFFFRGSAGDWHIFLVDLRDDFLLWNLFETLYFGVSNLQKKESFPIKTGGCLGSRYNMSIYIYSIDINISGANRREQWTELSPDPYPWTNQCSWLEQVVFFQKTHLKGFEIVIWKVISSHGLLNTGNLPDLVNCIVNSLTRTTEPLCILDMIWVMPLRTVGGFWKDFVTYFSRGAYYCI